MVRLFDIKEIGGNIQFICVPEGKLENAFVVVIDKKTKKIVNDVDMWELV